MEEIDEYNLHQYISYTLKPKINTIIINWDTTNNKLNKLMRKENLYLLSKDFYSNSMWVEEMKNLLQWEKGKTFAICLYSGVDIGKMTLYLINYPESYNYRYLKIDENGYLMMKINTEEETFKRCNCLYNDLLDEETRTYIFK